MVDGGAINRAAAMVSAYLGNNTTPSLTDWVTAISTAATAIAAGIAGWIAWRSLRRDIKKELPIVEYDFHWEKPELGNYVTLALIIRNQLNETLTLDRAAVRYPSKAFISGSATYGDHGMLTGIREGEAPTLTIGREIAPVGTASYMYSPPGAPPHRTDVAKVDLYLSPPENWNGGKVRVDLWISSKALTIRNRRIRIRGKVVEKPAVKREQTPTMTVPM